MQSHVFFMFDVDEINPQCKGDLSCAKPSALTIFIRRVQSNSCEWLKHTSENGGTPPTVTLFISGYQSQVGPDRIALMNIAVRTLGDGQVQHISFIFTMTLDLPRLLTVNNDCSAAASSPMHLQANHAPRVTPPIAHATCRKPRPHNECVFQHPVKRKNQPQTCSVHAQPWR